MTGRIFEIWGEQKYRKLLGEELRAKKKKKAFWLEKLRRIKTQLKATYLNFLMYY